MSTFVYGMQYVLFMLVSDASPSYGEGDVIISLSWALAHRVAAWLNTGKKDMASNRTPGRVATAFFSPAISLRLLDGHEPGWGRKTNFGRVPPKKVAYVSMPK